MSSRLIVADCRDALEEAKFVDAVICDPPYELGFLGHGWDASGIAYSVDLWRGVLVGTIKQTAIAYGTGVLNIDACRVERAEGDTSHAGHRTATFGTRTTVSGGDGSGGWTQNDAGRWPPNFLLAHKEEEGPCVEECPVNFQEARFFPAFRYQAKASKRERSGNTHPPSSPSHSCAGSAAS